MQKDSRITAYLEAHAAGREGAFDQIVESVYDQLRLLARRQLARGRRDSLDTCGLVHEAWVRLAAADGPWRDRNHFFAAASRAMRHVLVDAARRRGRQKRGRDWERLDVEPEALGSPAREEQLLALHEALERLAEKNERLARVVECRAFGGLTEEEIAEALGLSVRTVQRDVRAARTWLSTELGRERAPES